MPQQKLSFSPSLIASSVRPISFAVRYSLLADFSSRSVSIFKQQGTSPCTLFPFQMLSPSISFMICLRGSFVLREKPFLPATVRNNSGFPFPYYYIGKLCLLKVAATKTFFRLIPRRFKCPRDFLCRPSGMFFVSFLCLRPKKSSCASCSERDAPLKI